MSSYGVWMAAAGMQVTDYRQAVLANNLANSETTGFRHDLALIAQRRLESETNLQGRPLVHPVLDGMTGGISAHPTHYSFAQGPIEQTGQRLDAAIVGDGFFTVKNGNDVRYTRDGRFVQNSAGAIVLSAGGGKWQLLSKDGVPVVVGPGEKPRIQEGGAIRQGNTLVAELGVVAPKNQNAMRKVGENLFEAKATSMVPAGGEIRGGHLEGSNFDPMAGLAAMIQATRAYEMNARMLQLHDQLTGQVISTVGRVA